MSSRAEGWAFSSFHIFQCHPAQFSACSRHLINTCCSKANGDPQSKGPVGLQSGISQSLSQKNLQVQILLWVQVYSSSIQPCGSAAMSFRCPGRARCPRRLDSPGPVTPCPALPRPSLPGSRCSDWHPYTSQRWKAWSLQHCSLGIAVRAGGTRAGGALAGTVDMFSSFLGQQFHGSIYLSKSPTCTLNVWIF